MSKNKNKQKNTALPKTDVEFAKDPLTKLALKAQTNQDALTALQNLT